MLVVVGALRQTAASSVLGMRAAAALRMRAYRSFATTTVFTKSHEWIKVDGNNATVGITNYAQDQLGEIVYVDFPPIGTKLKGGDTMCTLESVKAVGEVYCPLPKGGEVTEVNSALEDSPSQVNEAAEGDGWLVKLNFEGEIQADGDNFLTAEQYQEKVVVPGDLRFTVYINVLGVLVDVTVGFHPTLQITAVSAMGIAENGVRRLRVVLSDGTHCSSAMPFGPLLQSNVQFRQFALGRCTFASANVKGKHVVLLKEYEEVRPPLRDTIGNPTLYRPSSAVANNANHENAPSHGNGMGQQNAAIHQNPPLHQYPTLDGPPQGKQQAGGYQYGGTVGTQYQQQQQQPHSGGSSSGLGSNNGSAASSGRQLPTYMQQQQPLQQQQQNQHKVAGPPLRAHPTNPYQQQPIGGGMLARQQSVTLGGNPQGPSAYGGSTGVQHQQQQQAAASRQQQNPYGAGAHHGGGGPVSYRPVANDIIPISQLSVYSQKWTIKGRVSSKSDVRTFTNSRGEGQLFSIEIVDDQSAEIRATFFNSLFPTSMYCVYHELYLIITANNIDRDNKYKYTKASKGSSFIEQAVTKFFPMIQQGRVYTFSKGQVKQANARFNPGATYELTFNDDAIIEESTDSVEIPRIVYKISKIATIQDRNPDEFVDLCGIVTHCSPVSMVTIRNSGNERARRNFTIADDSGCSIEMTVWGDMAQNCGVDENRAQYHPVVMIKNARIGSYGGRSLSAVGNTRIEVDPDDSRAFEVKNWWMQTGQGGAVQALSTGGGGGGGNAPVSVIEVMRMDNNLFLALSGQSDVPNARPVNTHTLQRATVSQIFKTGDRARNISQELGDTYADESSKSQQGLGIDGHQNQQCMPRYIINLKLADMSGEVLVRAFDEQAQALLGVSAQEMMQNMGEEDIEQVIIRAQFKKINARVRSKKEVYTDEERVNVSLTDFTAITDQNLQQDAQQMMQLINTYLQKVDPNGSRI
ncbi:60S acidic ribosomal protein P1 [Perkinsus chesapeaki]|uniref:60S acidic ribosomal protein P1 n=1 Tax=Perkinsus chesapeaki TaxID=330153 RepID=A0A7J6MVA0_PERCH|nr:60S acidic ribosomal protein P1 [Perkinsus chesapeaki]